MAERLHVSQEAVRNQVSTIFVQLGVRSRDQAVVIAERPASAEGDARR
jgi:DNA-binding NarL/FixJ family response regulator